MKRTQFVADRLREVLLNGKWIANTNYKEQLLDITWEQATHRIGNLNSIALLTFHVNYYLDGLLNVLNNGKLEMSDKYSFDLQEITDEKGWKKLVGDFLINAEKLVECVKQMDETKLDEPFVEERYGSYLRNIEAVIEHSYYHLGQISLIKKMISQNNG